jgi:hypothetical protein
MLRLVVGEFLLAEHVQMVLHLLTDKRIINNHCNVTQATSDAYVARFVRTSRSSRNKYARRIDVHS